MRGTSWLKKKEEKLRGRCDSFVVETNVHYPTDINLLFDAIGKAIGLVVQLCDRYEESGWRQSGFHLKQIKKLYRRVQQSRRSTSKNQEKRQNQDKKIAKAYQAYLDKVNSSLAKVSESVESLRSKGVPEAELASVERFIAHAERQIDQISRRVFHDEKIPHKEKVLSVFQEHTEWISKGKAGVPVELGLRVCVMEDQYQFILHHQVMEEQTDEEVAVPMVEETQKRFPGLRASSFDKGFHSPANQARLRGLLDLSVLPKKGRLSEEDKQREYSPEFVRARRKHSAVESAINGLEICGLDRCPDHGIDGFKRYVALAVLSRNIQRLGAILREKKIRSQRLKARCKKAA
jgi:IS5 family transposase